MTELNHNHATRLEMDSIMISLKKCNECENKFFGTDRAMFCCNRCKNIAWRRSKKDKNEKKEL